MRHFLTFTFFLAVLVLPFTNITAQEVESDKTSYTNGVRIVTTKLFELGDGYKAKVQLVIDPTIDTTYYIFGLLMRETNKYAKIEKGDLIYLTFLNGTVIRTSYDYNSVVLSENNALVFSFVLPVNYISVIIRENSIINEIRTESSDGYRINIYKIPEIGGIRFDNNIRLLNKTIKAG